MSPELLLHFAEKLMHFPSNSSTQSFIKYAKDDDLLRIAKNIVKNDSIHLISDSQGNLITKLHEN
jgi:hypothetical protein